ncbi:MAG TPA: hypothetical protein PLI74_13425, partial [Candidatus Kapabacteria bacterium]|nr:hypothetical protein [Candidatus Kapabacteria bacterium]
MKKTRHRHINFDEEDSALSDSLSNKTNKHSYRKTRLVDTKQTNAETHEGIVIAGVGALWLVNVMLNDYDKSVTTIECKAAGIIISEHQDASLIAVGDKVGIELQNNETSYTGTIVRVAQRYTRLSRVIAAKHKTEQVVVSNID